MRKIINNGVIILSIFLLSCNSENKEYYHIDLLKSKEVLYYSEFVDSITYIPLETNDECLIGKVKDIRITDSVIFILDEKLNRICMFNKEGTYIGKIDKRGEGPGEYGFLRQFYVDEKNSRIYLNDYGACRLLIYDMEGNFKEHISFDFPIEDFVVLRSGDFLFYRDWRRGREVSGFLLADSRGKIKKKLVDIDKRFLISLDNSWEFTEFGEGVMFISPVFNDIVYEYTQEDSLIVRYPFKILPVPKKKYGEDILALMHMKEFVRTIALHSEKWINLTYWSNEYELRVVQFSKEKNEYYIGNRMENDIDGREISGRGSETRNNTFTFLVDSEEDPEESNPVIQILHLK